MIRKGVIRCGLQAWKWTAILRVRPMDLTEIMISNKSFVKLASTFKFDSKSLNYIYEKTGSSCGSSNGFFHWNCQWRLRWGEWHWKDSRFHFKGYSKSKRVIFLSPVLESTDAAGRVKSSEFERTVWYGLNVGSVWVAELKGELALYARCKCWLLVDKTTRHIRL